jgi:competence protein ComGC
MASPLVAVLVISVIVAILIPAVGRARMHAQSVSEMTNLRAIADGTQMYARSHGGRLPLRMDDLVRGRWVPETALYSPHGERVTYVVEETVRRRLAPPEGGLILETLGDSVILFYVRQGDFVLVARANGRVERLSEAAFRGELMRSMAVLDAAMR